MGNDPAARTPDGPPSSMPVPEQGEREEEKVQDELKELVDGLSRERDEYLELARWTRMQLRAAHSEAAGDSPNILRRLSIERREWTRVMRGSSAALGRAMGRKSQLRRAAAALGQSWIRGMRRAQKLYNE